MPGEQGPVTKALAGPSPEILDRLGGLGAIQSPMQVLPPQDTEHLDVHDVRGRVIAVGGQPGADRFGAEPPINQLSRAPSDGPPRHRAQRRGAANDRR